MTNVTGLKPTVRAALIAVYAILALNAQVTPATPAQSHVQQGPAITYAPGPVITYTLKPGDDLQAVLDSYATATRDVVITVPVTYTYTKPIILRNRPGNHWITIQSAHHFDPNVRVSPRDAPDMPKLIATGQTGALMTEAGGPFKDSHSGAAHHYRLAGFEITAAEGNRMNYFFIGLGTQKETDIADAPHDISIVNCFIHAPATGEMVRGIVASGSNLEFRSNYIAGFKSTFMEANAILLMTVQNVLVENNYLDGACENMCTDCDGTSIRGFVSSNITVRHNWFFKDPNYASLKPAVFVKNLLEFKNGKNIVIDSNVLENAWAQNQNGVAILFTPRAKYGKQPANTLRNVTFTNNVVRHVAGGIMFAEYDDVAKLPPSSLVRAAHFVIENNLFDDVSGTKYGHGNFAICFQISGPPADMTFANNTCRYGAQESRPPVGFFLTNNTDLTDTVWKNNNLGSDVMGDGRYGPETIASKHNPRDPQLPDVPVAFDKSNVIVESNPHWQDLWRDAVPHVLFKPKANSGANLNALAEMEAHVKAGTY